jgi:hypothetical protein
VEPQKDKRAIIKSMLIKWTIMNVRWLRNVVVCYDPKCHIWLKYNLHHMYIRSWTPSPYKSGFNGEFSLRFVSISHLRKSFGKIHLTSRTCIPFEVRPQILKSNPWLSLTTTSLQVTPSTNIWHYLFSVVFCFYFFKSNL